MQVLDAGSTTHFPNLPRENPQNSHLDLEVERLYLREPTRLRDVYTSEIQDEDDQDTDMVWPQKMRNRWTVG